LSFLALLPALFAILIPTPSQAQTPNARPPGNRFLFIFDTSAPIHHQMQAIEKTAHDILDARADGQLHYGDTLGVWTFDSELHDGKFPLEVWLRGHEDEIFSHVTEFLKRQPAGKKSRLDQAMAGVAEVIKSPDTITIVVFSTGESPMQGTPFDQDINEAYQRTLRDMKGDRKPIVTVLQAKAGRFLKYTVNSLPWPVVIPELPIAIKTPPSPTPTPATATAAAPPPSTNPPVTPAPPVPAPKADVSLTPAISTASATAPAPIPTPAPAPAPVAVPKADILPTPAAIIPSTASSPAPTQSPTPTPVLTPPSGPAPSPKSTVQVAALKRRTAPPAPATTAPPMQRGVHPVIPPLASSKSNAAAKPPEHFEQPPPKPVLASTNSAPVQTAVAIPAATPTRPRTLLITGIAFFCIAMGLLFTTLRRFRSAAQPSLVTRSMNNLRK
jgi:hypothetical protein